MQKPTIRYVVAAVLVAAAAFGGFFVFDAQRRTTNIDALSREVDGGIEQMITAANDFAASQQAYVAQGQPQQPWFERSAMLLEQFGQHQSAVRSLLKTPGALTAADDINERFKNIVVIDSRAREYLGQGESLLAADLIFSEGQNSIAAVIKGLRTMHVSEQQTADARRSELQRQQWGILGGIAVIWLAGIVLLTPPVPSTPVVADVEKLSLLDRTPAAEGLRRAEPTPPPAPTTDLAAVADICGALARISDADSLRDALARAAAVLEARGLIVWLGAGEELFPALACGYDERLLARLGPIPRNATNATAAAWRSAEVRTVPAEATSHGAIVVPLSGVHGCVGVLAAELPEGRESDPTTRAVAAVIAAQLVAIVPAWPAPSASQPIAASGG